MRVSTYVVRWLVMSLTLSSLLAGPMLTFAQPRSFQETSPPPTGSSDSPASTSELAQTGGYDLALTMTAEPAQALVGEPITITLKIENLGGAGAENISLAVEHVPSFLEIDAVKVSRPEIVPAIEPITNTVALFYDRHDVGEIVTVDLLTTVVAESAPAGDPGNKSSAVVMAEGFEDFKNNRADVEVLVTPTATPTPTTTPTPSPSSSPGVTPIPSPSPTPRASPSPSALPSPTMPPSPPPSAPAKIELSVRVTPNPATVDGQIMIEVAMTNVGKETAQSVRLTNALPAFLKVLDIVPERRNAVIDMVDGIVVVSYEGLQAGHSVTTQILTHAFGMSGPKGDPNNMNEALASVDKRSSIDDFERTELIVTGGMSYPPARPAVTPTPVPTPIPSVPPARLPDTGSTGTTLLVLVLAAGTLIIGGFATQTMLRRRNAR